MPITSLASGASATISLAAGQTLNVLQGGLGQAVVSRGPIKNQSYTVGQTAAAIGPFQTDATVYLTSQSGGLRYFQAAAEDAVGREVRYDPAGPALTGDGAEAVTLVPKLSKRQWLTKGWMGLLATKANAADYTCHIQTVLEAPPCVVRIGVLNNTSSALTGVKVSVGNANTIGGNNSSASIAPTGSGAAWVDGTFGGATSGTIAAGSTVNTVDNPNVTWTDWISCPGMDPTDGTVGFPIHVRVEIPAANTTLPMYSRNDSQGWEDPANVAGRIWRMRSQAVLGVTTKGSFTSTTFDPNGIPILIQYIPRDAVNGFTFLALGDSTTEGSSATVRNYGWLYRAQRDVSTKDAPVEICNLAIGGASPSRFLNRAESLLPTIKPEVCAFQIFGVNAASTPLTNGNIVSMQFAKSRIQAVCSDYDIYPVLLTGLPTNPAAKNWGASDALRVAYNAANNRASSKYAVLDLASALSGETDANGQVNIKAGLVVSDNLHPSDAGHEALAVPAKDLFRKLLAAA